MSPDANIAARAFLFYALDSQSSTASHAESPHTEIETSVVSCGQLDVETNR